MDAFDTVITVTGHMETKEEFESLFFYAKERFTKLHKLYDIYNTYEGINNAATVNASAGKEPVQVEKELMDLLDFSVQWHDKTSGKVNVLFGSLLKIWHDYREMADMSSSDNDLPDMHDLEEADKFTSIDFLEIDRNKMTVYISDPNARMDLGAVAKGYATQIVCDELIEKGYTSFAITAGGNVVVHGPAIARDREEWIIGIQDPDGNVVSGPDEELMDKVLVKDTSVVTSGIYQRYFYSGDKLYHHIIDPVTLFPADIFKSVTVVHPDSGISDALSTALMLMEYEDGKTLIQSIPGAESYWIFMDGTIKTTDGMEDILLSRRSS